MAGGVIRVGNVDEDRDLGHLLARALGEFSGPIPRFNALGKRAAFILGTGFAVQGFDVLGDALAGSPPQ